ncbi:MAG: DUF2953 domain-containing protein [Butyricicoccus sp.]
MLLLKILGIVLAILFGLVLLLILATVPRAGVRVIGKDGLAGIWVRYGWLKLRIYPFPKRKKAKKPAESAKPEKPVPEKKESPFDFSKLDLGDTICLVLDLLDELRNALRLDTVRVNAMLATGDAARTGILLGQLAALAGMITPFLEQNFVIRDYHIAVDGDFQGNTTHWDAEIVFSVRPVRMVWALVKRWRTLKRLYDSIQKTEANET